MLAKVDMSPMKGEKITLSQRQLQRYRVMSLVEAGKVRLKEAAEKIGRSYRQTKRIRRRFQEQGVKGLMHGNPGKLPCNGLPRVYGRRF